ncbi:MAG: NAD(P)-dependent oxidoreductase [Verrucomicrobiae bacterium]|nr:NAD(P)-dependent oxidoreductase [Verrucomicrobiae bacterium]
MSLFQDNPDKVGIIGLGIVGSRVAEVLRHAGYHVYVWNRSPRPEPNFLSSPGELALLAEVIEIFVTDGDALLSVVEGLRDRLTRRHVIINHSTVDPDSTRRAADVVQQAGGAFLDAPFTGSKLAAEKGALVYYVGGDPKVLERVRPILEKTAKEVLYVGGIGDATLLKIATNMISATTVQVLAEAYALTKSAGVDPEKLSEALEHNASGSVLTAMKMPAILSGEYEPHFSLKNMFKDAQIALNLANRQRVDVPALSSAASVMFRGLQKGWGEEDYSVVARHYQEGAIPAKKT